jgi:hypothetical protein
MTIGIWAPPDKSDHNRTCSGPNPNLPIQRIFFKECPEPSWGHHTSLTGMVDQSNRSSLTGPTDSFQILYKRHSTRTLMGCWFLNIFITFWQPLELSPTFLCEIQALGARFLSWVERFVLWALILSLEHFELHQALVKHLLLLEVKPPRLGVALEIPRVWWVLRKFVNVHFTSGRKEAWD